MDESFKTTLDARLRNYRSQHRTVGCKLTHMFGVPMIALSLPAVLVDWRLAGGLFATGWALQFLGHYVFEKNSPVFMSDPRDPYTYISAVIFVTEEWAKALSGQPLAEPVKELEETRPAA